MIAIPVVLLVIALFVGVVAALAWTKRLPGNSYIGIRAPEARESKENWDITHQVAGPPWAAAAGAFLGSAALALLATQPESSGWLWFFVVLIALVGVFMIGVGAAIGSHTIAILDTKRKAESDDGDCCSSGGCGSTAAAETSHGCGSDDSCGSCGSCENSAPAAGSKPANVDLDALRRAAGNADGQGGA
ncbi:SdpI family protein [Corynebacterium sp. TAE3-ERU12]|uniref:SdpI family protein n=1 Tax=Corynebacterium sp. TAE3-ERU12 TaxID=2849491 RepID=UPI001C4561C2|nr:SdpI family protein [Corynebacterium sp. TAE3-ERU12]MBV7294326.1 SdpI family protein [Corynebacterium sp. TAE3-ERU12]